MLQAVTEQTFTHRCESCGGERAHLPLAPATEHLHVSGHDLVVRCPCGATEHWPHEALATLAQCARGHPDSLVGTVLEGGGVVVEDSRYELPAHAREQVEHALALHRHPAVAAARAHHYHAAGQADPLAPFAERV